MSSTTDLTALVAVFKIGNKFRAFPFCFMPRETIRKRALDDRIDYVGWMEQGFIIPCEGSSISQNQVIDKIRELLKDFKVMQLILDPWKAAYIAKQLEKEIPLIGLFKQDMKNYTAPCSFFESLVNDLRLEHNHPVLDWCAQNVEIYKGANNPNENMRPVKPDGERGRNMRIDVVVALIMALSAYMEGAQTEKPRSVYEDPNRSIYI
jgi:phage terminase large subunit-like protein